MTQVNPNFIVEGFNSFVASSGILSVLFNVIVFIVVFLYVVAVVRTYGKFVTAEQIKVSDVVKPFSVLLLIIFWKWIYFDVLVKGFDALMGLAINHLDRNAAATNTELYGKVTDSAVGEEISLMDLSIESFVSWVLKAITLVVNVIIDVFVALYVGVNDIILAILAPICLAFSMLDETKDIFMKWLKTFIVFRVYLMLVIIVNQLSISLMSAIVAKAMGSVVGVAAAAGGNASAAALTGIAGVALLGYVLFKILFLLSSFKMLNNFFGVGDGGVGGGAAGMSGAVVKGVKMAATKGAAK